MEEITFEEFVGTVYYTKNKIVVPILDIRLDKSEYFNKNKLNKNKLNKHLKNLYDELNKF